MAYGEIKNLLRRRLGWCVFERGSTQARFRGPMRHGGPFHPGATGFHPPSPGFSVSINKRVHT